MGLQDGRDGVVAAMVSEPSGVEFPVEERVQLLGGLDEAERGLGQVARTV
ncbi:hypothetical protein [Actinomadura napierensis]